MQDLFVESEWLQWRLGSRGKPVRFLNFHQGRGTVVAGKTPDETDERINEQLDDPSALAANMFGQLARHPRISALRRFIQIGISPNFLPMPRAKQPTMDRKSDYPQQGTICPTLSNTCRKGTQNVWKNHLVSVKSGPSLRKG